MLVIGLTGGIGSGKSTVGKLFSELGINVVDADKVARDVTQVGQPALQEITDKFGPEILSPDGTLNRAALRKIVFADTEKREWLENLLHPLIRAEMKRLLRSQDMPYCIVMIPLLLETEPNPLIDRILVVDVPESEQIKRTEVRDNATADEIKAIMKTQVSRSQRLAAADDIIENAGTLAGLMPQIKRLHDFYCALSKKNSMPSTTEI